MVKGQVEDSTFAHFNLKGAIKSVEVNVVSFNLVEENKGVITRSLGEAKYEFSKEGRIINKFDNIPLQCKPNRTVQIDTLIIKKS